MNSAFKRSEQLEDQIQTIKLKISEWKVLFAIDGVMNPEQMSDFLGMPEKDVLTALKKFKDMELIARIDDSNAETDTQIPPETDEMILESEPELEEKASEPESFEGEDRTEEEEVVEGRIELSPDEPSEEETSQSLLDAPEEEFAETEESDKGDLADQEFDDFIGGLLNDEEKKEQLSLEVEEEPTLESEMPLEGDDLQEDSPEETEMPTDVVEGEEEKEGQDVGLSDFSLAGVPEAELEIEEEEKETEVFDEEKLEEKVAPEASEAEELPGRKKTILVVDDSVVIRKMVEIALENEQFDIKSVANGKDALKYLDDNNPDIIILDIMLPDVNGLDVLKAVKASKQIPVVMLSAKDTPRETSRAKELGADDFIPKPFKDEELVSKIKELVGE